MCSLELNIFYFSEKIFTIGKFCKRALQAEEKKILLEPLMKTPGLDPHISLLFLGHSTKNVFSSGKNFTNKF